MLLDRTFARRIRVLTETAILTALTNIQYLHPHRPLAKALEMLQRSGQLCPDAATRAVDWLALDPSGAIGRLQRAQLVQLAHSAHRFWRQSATDDDEQ